MSDVINLVLRCGVVVQKELQLWLQVWLPGASWDQLKKDNEHHAAAVWLADNNKRDNANILFGAAHGRQHDAEMPINQVIVKNNKG